MSDIQNETEVLKRRKNVLKDDEAEGLQVTASLRDQQIAKLANKLIDLDIPSKVVSLWNKENADRSDWFDRQENFLREVDEFIEPIYTPATDWSSTIHLPTILTICKTYHARMMTALWGIDPPFVVRARTAANEDRAMLIEQLMRYTLRDWANEYEGVEEELDKWLWDWILKGNGILKGRWAKKFTRFLDVEVDEVQDVRLEMDPETGDSAPVPFVREVEREVVRTEVVCDGPMLECVPLEDVVIIGGEGDPKKADAVIHSSFMTASELWSASDQKLFRQEAVEKIIQGGSDNRTTASDTGSNIKQQQRTQSGMTATAGEQELDRYQILEAYLKVDVDGSGITSDVIVWVHKASRELVRATYLRRVNPSGRIPFFNIQFHKRHGSNYAAGLVELLYSLGKEIDAMHNINVDIGILSSLPFGFYRPTASALKEEGLPVEPGVMIPVDNPQTDVMFPNLGLRTSFGYQEEAALMNQIERLTSISELNLGIIGAQGATRTATGTRAILGESSNNLSVYIARMNRGWKRALRFMFEQLQQRMPPGFEFRITGEDGRNYWAKIESRQELEGMFDFELDANSANSNKQQQIEQAALIYQATANPMDLQLGIVTPANRYEALVNYLKVSGVKAVGKYATKPTGFEISFSPVEMLDRILAGIDVKFSPQMDLQGFVALASEFLENEELNGQFGPAQMAVIQGKLIEAAQLLQALQQMQANASVGQQQFSNTMQSQTPGASQALTLPASPAPSEGAAE